MWVMSQLRELALPACVAAPVAEFVVMSLAPQLHSLYTTVEVRAVAQGHMLPRHPASCSLAHELVNISAQAQNPPRVFVALSSWHEGP